MIDQIKQKALNNYSVEIILDSISPNGVRLTTMKLVYPRFIHGEVMTHRAFSRNASSSRAIPTSRLIEMIVENTALPLYWGELKAGMQAGEELNNETIVELYKDWIKGRDHAVFIAKKLHANGLHKQHVNRPIEPYMLMETLVTATEWDNFFELRCHEDAQPEIQHLANLIRDAMEASTPVKRKVHIPFTTDDDWTRFSIEELVKIATANCARVSYTLRNGEIDHEKNFKLHDMLVVAEPIHASPAEHIAWAVEGDGFIRNFRGWMQYRVKLEEGE